MREHVTTDFLLLPLHEVDICEHAIGLEARGEFGSRGCVQVQPCEGDELENEALLAEVPDEVLQVLIFALSQLPHHRRDINVGGITRTREALGGPVEARAQVVHEPLSGVLLPDLAREATRLGEVGELRLKPDHVRVRREGEFTFDGGLNTARIVIVALAGLRDCENGKTRKIKMP